MFFVVVAMFECCLDGDDACDAINTRKYILAFFFVRSAFIVRNSTVVDAIRLPALPAKTANGNKTK